MIRIIAEDDDIIVNASIKIYRTMEIYIYEQTRYRPAFFNYDIVRATYLFGVDVRRIQSLPGHLRSFHGPYRVLRSCTRKSLRHMLTQYVEFKNLRLIHQVLSTQTQHLLSRIKRLQRIDEDHITFSDEELTKHSCPLVVLQSWIDSQRNLLQTLSSLSFPRMPGNSGFKSMFFPNFSSLSKVTDLSIHSPESCMPFVDMPSLRRITFHHTLIWESFFRQLQAILSLRRVEYIECKFERDIVIRQPKKVENQHIVEFLFRNTLQGTIPHLLQKKGPFPLVETDDIILLTPKNVSLFAIKHLRLDATKIGLGPDLVTDSIPPLEKLDVTLLSEDANTQRFLKFIEVINAPLTLINVTHETVTSTEDKSALQFSCVNSETVYRFLLAIKIFVQDHKHYPLETMKDRFCRKAQIVQMDILPATIAPKRSGRKLCFEIAKIALYSITSLAFYHMYLVNADS